MKRSNGAVAAMALGLALAWPDCRIVLGGGRLSSHVNTDAIKSIQLGMNQEQVVGILGAPIEVYTEGDDATLEFCAERPGSRWYPMLWVHFRQGKVREVYAKRYILWGGDDHGVYGLSNDGPWETDDFARTFPSSLSQTRANE